jgi:hypothetical protein
MMILKGIIHTQEEENQSTIMRGQEKLKLTWVINEPMRNRNIKQDQIISQTKPEGEQCQKS